MEGGLVKVLREEEDHKRWIGVETPCVVTITKPGFAPRYPTVKRKMAAKRAVIETLTPDDLPNIDLTRAGLKGSPTKVKKTFVPTRKKDGVKIREESCNQSAKKLLALLTDAKLI